MKTENTILINGISRSTTNSEGKPIAGTKDELIAFWSWFRDSKMVDERDMPLVVYHGTKEYFEKFDTKQTVDGGIHFGTQAQAKMRSGGKGRVLIPAYINIEDFQRSKDIGGKWAAKIKTAKSAGKDGIVYLNRYEGITSEIMLRLINQGVWDKLDRMSDAQFRKVVPEAADSYITFSTGNIKTVLSVTDVTPIQKELKDTEQAMGAGVAKHGTPQWQELANKAALIRKRLVDLTGDCYGAPRFAKKREIPPSDELLNAGYATPDEVPKEVMGWLICHNQIIMSDATDAVRWARIVNTLDDDRYPKGSLTIYRAVATNSIPDIRPGDWVTTNIAYAEQHLEKYFDGNGEILTLDADGADVLVSPTGNGEESIYAPMEFSGEYKPQECEAPSPQ